MPHPSPRGGQGAARPTGESPEYTAPITLNDSQTIRAVAFSDGGLESREFSATYSLMSVGSAVAKPRYPWNGKVDIDCEVKGDANRQYLVSLEAIDLDGGTNLPMRTVVGRGAPTAPQSPANEFSFGGRGATALPPGTYRFTWDADANIAGDEMLTYSSVWDGGDGATVTIAQDGAALVKHEVAVSGDGFVHRCEESIFLCGDSLRARRVLSDDGERKVREDCLSARYYDRTGR